MNDEFLKSIASVLESARKNAKTAVNLTMVYAYFEIGRIIVEEEQNGKNRAAYGKQILQELSEYLTAQFGKGFSVGNLKNIRQFYRVYADDQIGETVFSQFENLPATDSGRRFYLSWSHYLKLMRIDNVDERHFYEIEAVKNEWSLSELKRQFNSALYERLALSRNKDKVYALALEGQVLETPADVVKDPYILEFLGLQELSEYSESEMESRIIDHLQQFLLELGKGFAFVGRQVRFTFDEEHFRVDLVFYNRLLRCFVLFDLKIGELKHQDIGQMQMYVNYYDRKVKLEDENPTIGIILCKDKNNAVVEMTLPEDNSQIFASKYETVLPSKEELQKLLTEHLGDEDGGGGVMKIQYRHQKFQADAAKAVVDVFAGQPNLTSTYMMDRGSGNYQIGVNEELDFTGFGNQKIVPELSDRQILEQLNKVQRTNQIKPSEKLEGRENGYNLTVEMETGVGKTYTYIKTMFELNKHYGWSKFIVIVPSVAIREGVYKSFEMTQEHFAEEYGKKIRFFIYNSAQLTEIDRFASDSSINVMIINSQAFNAKGKDARRIYMKLDEFRSRRPIDIIAKTNPILIIDEPQSVEGKQTKERLKEFHPLLTLRYSATHKSDSVYNMVFRLDAMEAYNRRLVKKIAVKGITESGSTATDSFIYLESINLSKSDPTATLQFEVKMANGAPKKKSRIVKIGDNLYDYSGGLEEYRNGFVVKQIDGRDDSVEFLNGIKIFAGDVIGAVDEDQLRRIQIRETILSHIERERQLFYKGIKVLSLFFIDEVANYREYDAAGQPVNGKYAAMFEEEYEDVISSMQLVIGEDEYIKYLQSISAVRTHAGYFSVDGKGKMINSKVSRKETTSDDVSAYELIMKNKELLLDRDPARSPVRFLFSHSALREGWDNPNVFQICTLKQSESVLRKRQEVGRGLRLCVNQNGERMDTNVLGNDVHNINILTVIASESYDSFAKGLQTEMAEAVADRPRAVKVELFAGKVIKDEQGNEQVIDQDMASSIHHDMIVKGYIDSKGALTDKYYEDKANGEIKVAKEVADSAASVLDIIDSIYDARSVQPENARSNNVELLVDEDKLAMPEFEALWSRINAKSVYVVDFDTEELIQKSITSLDSKLRVSKIHFQVETGIMDTIKSKEELLSGTSFVKEEFASYGVTMAANSNVKYDLIGKLVDETGLTRKALVAILKGIQPSIFNQFRDNPEEFIVKAAALINDEKATAVIEHITYDVLDDHYGTDIFTDPTIKGRLGINAMKAKKHLYDHIVYDSTRERDFAAELDVNTNVAVYVKLPDGFYIATPVGHYNPDWAIAFYKGSVKHIYFVAETKGSMRSMQWRTIEQSKIHCAKEHFKAISGDNIVYDVVDSYKSLLTKVMR